MKHDPDIALDTISRQDAHQHHIAANIQANEFARTGLSNIVLLNGGAILAFAPIGSLFAVKVSAVAGTAIASMACFVLGLLVSIFAYLMGYLVNSRLAEFYQKVYLDHAHDTMRNVISEHNSYRALAIQLAFGSVGLFILGALLGGAAIYQGS